MRFGILLSSGIILTILGFSSVKKSSNSVNSIILGTGEGLLFISILSANMYFNYIGNITSMILASIWSIFFILSYKLTGNFFTSIIAYIGTYISIILGLSLVTKGANYIVLLLFTTGISALMIITSLKWTNSKKQILGLLLSILNYATLLFWGLDNEISLGMNFTKYSAVLFTIILIVIYYLLNYIYKLIEGEGKNLWYLALSFFPTILISILTISYLESISYFFTSTKISYFLFIIINLIELIFIEFKLKSTSKSILKYYIIMISFGTLMLNYKIFDLFLGLTFITVILSIIDRITKHSTYTKIIPVMLLIDLFLVFAAYDPTNNFFILYGLLQILVAIYILYKKHIVDKTNITFGLKTVCLFVYMISISNIFSNISYTLSGNISEAIRYLGKTITIILLSIIGFFKKWDSDDLDKTKFWFYYMTTTLYIEGVILINSTYSFEQFIVILSTLAIALTQTTDLLKHYNEKIWIGFWIGIKYWILTLISLTSLFNLDVNSIVLSVVGLIIALGSIAIGFIRKSKGLRLYGLMLTILMVLKFIVVDLSQENSIIRIIALLLGGLICFGISALYNKLNTIIQE